MQYIVPCNCRCSPKNVVKLRGTKYVLRSWSLLRITAYGVPSSWSTEARIAQSVTVTILQTLNPKSCLRFLAEEKGVTSSLSHQSPANYIFQWIKTVLSPRVKRPEREIDHSVPYISEINLSFYVLPPVTSKITSSAGCNLWHPKGISTTKSHTTNIATEVHSFN